MKIKYLESNGTIIAIGDMPDLKAGDGEIVEDFFGKIPTKRIDFFKRVSEGVIDEKSQSEKDNILNSEKKSKLDQIPVSEVVSNLIEALKEKGAANLKIDDVEAKAMANKNSKNNK